MPVEQHASGTLLPIPAEIRFAVIIKERLMLNVKRSVDLALLEPMDIALPKQVVLRQLHHKDAL